MAESHVVSGLVAKHAELAGLIQFHRAEIERVASDLKHLDATLKLFAPEMDLRSLGSKRVNSSRTGGFKRFESRESHTWVCQRILRIFHQKLRVFGIEKAHHHLL